MGNGDVIMNTENHGVMRFNEDKLIQEQNSLNLADLETLIEKKEGYSVICMYANKKRRNLNIVSESATEKKLNFQRLDSSKKYELVFKDYQLDRPH